MSASRPRPAVAPAASTVLRRRGRNPGTTHHRSAPESWRCRNTRRPAGHRGAARGAPPRRSAAGRTSAVPAPPSPGRSLHRPVRSARPVRREIDRCLTSAAGAIPDALAARWGGGRPLVQRRRVTRTKRRVLAGYDREMVRWRDTTRYRRGALSSSVSITTSAATIERSVGSSCGAQSDECR